MKLMLQLVQLLSEDKYRGFTGIYSHFPVPSPSPASAGRSLAEGALAESSIVLIVVAGGSCVEQASEESTTVKRSHAIKEKGAGQGKEGSQSRKKGGGATDVDSGQQ